MWVADSSDGCVWVRFGCDFKKTVFLLFFGKEENVGGKEDSIQIPFTQRSRFCIYLLRYGIHALFAPFSLLFIMLSWRHCHVHAFYW